MQIACEITHCTQVVKTLAKLFLFRIAKPTCLLTYFKARLSAVLELFPRFEEIWIACRWQDVMAHGKEDSKSRQRRRMWQDVLTGFQSDLFPRPRSLKYLLWNMAVREPFLKALFCHAGLFRKSITSPENWQKQQEDAFLERVVCSYFETPRRGDFNAAATLCK